MIQYPKKHIEKARACRSKYEELYGKMDTEVVSNMLDPDHFMEWKERLNWKLYHIWPRLSGMRDYFVEISIIRRILDNELESFVKGIVTGSRFGCLVHLIAPGASGGCDCQQVYPILTALAVRDMPVVDMLVNRFPGPSKKGFRPGVILCNGVYAVLGKHPDIPSVRSKLESKKATKYFMALYKGLLAALDHDPDLLIEAIEQLLKVNGRQDYRPLMENIFCLEAHALVELYRLTGGDIDLTNFGPPWDADFDTWKRNHANLPAPFDLSQASPGLNRWVHLLPEELFLEDLGL